MTFSSRAGIGSWRDIDCVVAGTQQTMAIESDNLRDKMVAMGAVVRSIILWTIAAVAILGDRAALSADAVVLGGPPPILVGGPPPFVTDVAVPTLFYFWNGPYLGLHGGWGWTSTKGLNASGDFGGGDLGYNYQSGNLVFGLEADGSFANMVSHGVTTPFLGVPNAVTYRDDGLASLRGRFGVAMNGILIYGTAGGGWVHSRASTAFVFSSSFSTTAETWQSGWAAGAGVEYGFLPNWTVKVEYLHFGVGNATYFGAFNTGNVGVETVKIGVNYLFR
jgi:outer membrane immunogenic protein